MTTANLNKLKLMKGRCSNRADWLGLLTVTSLGDK